jgi:hypothetical protein
MLVILYTSLAMYVYSWNQMLHLNYIIWCYYARYSLYNDIITIELCIVYFVNLNCIMLLNETCYVDNDELG